MKREKRSVLKVQCCAHRGNTDRPQPRGRSKVHKHDRMRPDIRHISAIHRQDSALPLPVKDMILKNKGDTSCRGWVRGGGESGWPGAALQREAADACQHRHPRPGCPHHGSGRHLRRQVGAGHNQQLPHGCQDYLQGLPPPPPPPLIPTLHTHTSTLASLLSQLQSLILMSHTFW